MVFQQCRGEVLSTAHFIQHVTKTVHGLCLMGLEERGRCEKGEGGVRGEGGGVRERGRCERGGGGVRERGRCERRGGDVRGEGEM